MSERGKGRRNRRSRIGAAGALALSLAVGPAVTAARGADYRTEAEAIVREIVEVHPRGPEIARDPDFVKARAALLEHAGDTDLAHYAMALGRLFHAVADGHTAAIPMMSDLPLFAQRYPLRLERFDDGLWVVAASGPAEALLGTRLTRIGDRPIEEVVRAFVDVQGGGNAAWPVRWAAAGVTIPGYLIGLDVVAADAGARFEGRSADGRIVAAELDAGPRADAMTPVQRRESLLERLAKGRANFVAELDEGRVLALVIGAMGDQPEASFESFTAEAAAAIAATEAERVVIDLRTNGGGNNMLAEPLRRTLVKSRFNRPGGLFVLTSPRTFSAAMNFATRLERETDALFVGEPTGGAPNHFGDARFTVAPASRIPYLVSTLRWQDSPPFDRRPWILPDIPAVPTFADHLAGRDAALDAARAHDAGPAPQSDWRSRVVEPWERPSQKIEWRFFHQRPPSAASVPRVGVDPMGRSIGRTDTVRVR